MMTHSKITCWGIGISTAMESMLTGCFGQTVSLHTWPEDSLPTKAMFESASPIILFVSPAAEKALQALPLAQRQPFNDITRICILPENYSQSDLELGIGVNAVKILPFNASKKDIWNILHATYEAQNMPHDIHYMTRELLLERELLERKNSLLSFLVTFFANTAQSDNLTQVFENSFSALSLLFPLDTMQAATWFKNAVGNTEATLFINTPESSTKSTQWEKMLRSHILEATNNEHSIVRGKEALKLPQGSTILPKDIHTFPLHFGNADDVQGLILLGCHKQPVLGRDQSETLATALSHLSTIVANHYFLNSAKIEANVDPLTGLYNRRHLMTSLGSEITRSKRYNNHLSVMMLDLDHFKNINDTYGHQAGDLVLQKVGKILHDTLRNTDIAYRYGGEEFCVIMPETAASKAFPVAERLRKAIANYPFMLRDTTVHVTTSIGLASLESVPAINSAEEFLAQADELLYTAKARGRNCTEAADELLKMHVV